MLIKEYKTTDIVLAAYLRVEGLVIETVEKVGQKGTFVFKDVPGEVISDYDLGRARVEPVAFNNAIKQLTTTVRRMV